MQLSELQSSPSPSPTRRFRSQYAVILASGAEDGGMRATLALAAACAAQAMDPDTIVFLLGDGAFGPTMGTRSGCTRRDFRR